MLLCGKIVNTHGIAGEVKVLYYTDGPEFFDNIEYVLLKNGTKLTIKRYRVHKGALIMDFAEIPDMNFAETLKEQELFVPKDKLPPLPEGRYYIADLLGCEVFTDSGRNLGKIADVFQTGSNDVYTVKNGKKEYLIPVIDDVVRDIDIENKRITITPIEGLIDDED